MLKNEIPGVEMMPISQAGQLLGVSIQTLRRWDKAGTLRATYVSPGGHRYYAKSDLEQYTRHLLRLAREWAADRNGVPPAPESYCQTSAIFQSRLSSFEGALRKLPDLAEGERFSLIVSVVGEIGDNAYSHNLGNWPDVPGAFFSYDVNRRNAVVADRGLGVLTTLRRVRPSLPNDREAVRVAFTEFLSGRAPEKRGNGLKYVREVVAENGFSLLFQSGNAVLTLGGPADELRIARADVFIRGTLAFLDFSSRRRL